MSYAPAWTSEMIEIKEEQGINILQEDFYYKTMSTMENNNNAINSTSVKEIATDNDNEELENENLILNIKKEDNIYEGEGEDGNMEEPESTQMSTVETATLLLLSRIALFNKVGVGKLKLNSIVCFALYPQVYIREV